MSFDGSGNYTPPAAPAFPAVGGTTIQAGYYNSVINDIAAALSICITRDGQGKPSANIDWNAKNLTNVATLGAATLTLTNPLAIASGGLNLTAIPANGQIPIGNGATYVLANITGTGGITVTNGAGTIQISFTGGAITASPFTMATARLLGRTTAATGAIEEISIGAGLSLAAGVLSATGGGGVSLAKLTMNNGGAGDASGSQYDGSVAKTLSWNTLGAQPRTPQKQTAGGNSVTPTFNDDIVERSGANGAITLNNPTGTAVDGFGIVIRLKDNGTARAISYGTQYRAMATALPTTTVSNKWLYLGMIFNNADTKWDVVSVVQQA